jgi:GDP-4-dehydro-6-deoxy-D-mannose reductase
MRALVTGGGGFVGQWVARALLERGDETYLAGIGIVGAGPKVLTAAEWGHVRWIRADMRSDEAVRAMVEESRPDLVIHLAGVSAIAEAESAPTAAYDVNVLGAVRLLAELSRLSRAGAADPTTIVVGSGTQYGRHDDSEMPLVEGAEQRPPTAYAATKAAQEIAALQYFHGAGMRVICTRSFNHSGAGQDTRFVLPSLVARARKVAAAGGALTLGADAVRDYLHVSDVARAYLLLGERGSPGGVYNVCSGTGVSVRTLAARVLQRAGVTAEISTDPALLRAADVPVLVGSPDRLTRATGWTITRTTDDIIDDLLHATTD